MMRLVGRRWPKPGRKGDNEKTNGVQLMSVKSDGEEELVTERSKFFLSKVVE